MAQDQGTQVHSSVLAPAEMPPGRALGSEMADPPGEKALSYPQHFPEAYP